MSDISTSVSAITSTLYTIAAVGAVAIAVAIVVWIMLPNSPRRRRAAHALFAFGIAFLLGTYLFVVAPAQAQTVFKCTGPDGSPVFSQSQCGNDAQEVEVKVVAPSSEQIENAGEESRSRLAARKVEQDEIACIRRVERSANGASDRRARDYNARINALERRIGTAANNFAGATWEIGMREEIASLHQAIAMDRASADSVVASGRQRCMEERQRREDQL